MLSGFVYCQVIVSESGNPVDFIILEANTTFENMFGLKNNSTFAKKASDIYCFDQNDPLSLVLTLGKIALTGEAKKFEQYFVPSKKWYALSAYSPTKNFLPLLYQIF